MREPKRDAPAINRRPEVVLRSDRPTAKPHGPIGRDAMEEVWDAWLSEGRNEVRVSFDRNRRRR